MRSAGEPPSGATAMGDVLGRLPHRPPFRFVTRLLELSPGIEGLGEWDVAETEPSLAGHFPGRPIVPGVLVIEALAQVSGLVAFGGGGSVGARLGHVDVKILGAARPPATIRLRSRLVRELGSLRMLQVVAELGSDVIAKGTLTLAAETIP